MEKIKLRSNYGFAASDALVAIIIITMFTGIIAALSYNIYLSNASLKRMSKANNYIIDVFEYSDKLYYGEVTEDNLLKYLNGKYDNSEVIAVNDENANVEAPFKIIIKVQNYKELEGNEEKLDLVKEITATVQYKLGNREQTITMKRSKNREKIITPNKPDLSTVGISEGQKVYPVKQKNGKYVVCNENDSNWYNYNNNIYPIVGVTNVDLKMGDTIEDGIAKYKWIPRYAVNANNSEDIKYLFSNTNMYLEEQYGENKLVNIEGTEYNVENIFTSDSTGIWQEI